MAVRQHAEPRVPVFAHDKNVLVRSSLVEMGFAASFAACLRNAHWAPWPCKYFGPRRRRYDGGIPLEDD